MINLKAKVKVKNEFSNSSAMYQLKVLMKLITEPVVNFKEPVYCSPIIKIGSLNLFSMEPQGINQTLWGPFNGPFPIEVS